MHDLQLVGFTTDRRGLIFRTSAGARVESYVVPLTDELVRLVTQLAESSPDDDPAEVDADLAEPVVAVAEPRVESQLSVRDIQARLRAGEDVARVAAEAGVDDDWIERFAPPVRAEQRRIVERALECHLQRSRGAPSSLPLRRAVGKALADKGLAFTVAAFEAAWSARLLGHDRWAVEFTYYHRGRDRTARWDFDAADDSLTTNDRTASQLGYVGDDAGAADAGLAVEGIIGDPAAPTQIGADGPTRRRATGRGRARGSGSSSKPATAPRAAPEGDAGRKTASKKAASKKKAASTRTSGSRKAASKKSGSKKASSKKAAPTRATKKAAAPKKAAPKKTAPKRATKKAAPKKTAPKRATKKAAAPKKAAPKKAAPKRATKKAAAPKKATPEKAAPTKAAPEKATRRPAAPTQVGSETAATPDRLGSRPTEAEPTTTSTGPAAPEPAPPPADEATTTPAPADAAAEASARLTRDELDRLVPAVAEPASPNGTGREPAAPAAPEELDRVRARRVARQLAEDRAQQAERNQRPGAADPAADPAAARRARAAERSAPTVQFRSGSAAPVRVVSPAPPAPRRDAGAAQPDRTRSPRPDAADEAPSTAPPADANGAARPRSRRRRQLRAR